MAQGVDFKSNVGEAGWGSYFSSLDCSIISVSGNTVTVDGKLVSKPLSSYQLRFSYDGTELFTITENFPYSLETYYGDNVFYCQGAGSGNRRFVVLYEKLNGEILLGYQYSNSAGTARYGFNSITLTNLSTNATYTHGIMMNHTCDAGYIDYIPFTGLFASGYKKKNDDNFLACSIVTQGITVTIDGKNYYAVSTSDLFPLS